MVLATTAAGASEVPQLGSLVGRVFSAEEPLSEARVFLYRTVERSLRQAVTGEDGAFRFLELPPGLYKVVAYKPGFIPEVTRFLLEQASAGTLQLHLQPQDGRGQELDYWKIRSEVPSDILREMVGLLPIAAETSLAPEVSGSRLTAMTAVTGVEFSAGSEAAAQVSAGSVEVGGQLGSVRLAVQGDYRKRAPDLSTPWSSGFTAGSATRLSVSVETPEASSLVLDTSSRNWEYGHTYLSESEHSQIELRYRKHFGQTTRADLRAGYEAYRGWGVHGLSWLPYLGDSARTLWLDGRLSARSTETTRLLTGLRFEETSAASRHRSTVAFEEPQRTLEAFGILEWRPDSLWLVQYGMVTRLADGSLEFAPQGSLVLRLGSGWQAGLEGVWRFAWDQPKMAGFRTASLSAFESFPCRISGGSCIQLRMEHAQAETRQFVLGVSWREVATWTRLLFTDSLVPQGEGVLLLPGDGLPGVELEIRQRLGGSWDTRWSARYAGGGGGVAQVGREVLANEVEWWASALAVSYLPWSSGFFASFQRLDQAVEIAGRPGREGRLERVELALTQELGELFDLAREWTLRLGFEVSRGASLLEPASNEPELLRQRLTTGFAVRF